MSLKRAVITPNPHKKEQVGTVEQYLHGWVFSIRGSSSGNLYSSYAKTPDICFVVVALNLKKAIGFVSEIIVSKLNGNGTFKFFDFGQ